MCQTKNSDSDSVPEFGTLALKVPDILIGAGRGIGVLNLNTSCETTTTLTPRKGS
ncbi:hypothetical protein D1AOALGA4SA_9023 [Olavius algarvensis Delta 1 endosymbiont]|nr:hypothetical protein D1AOALGA4SA_9023 [Olavius algarvensis Delta 1 endosymbiont]